MPGRIDIFEYFLDQDVVVVVRVDEPGRLEHFNSDNLHLYTGC